MQEVAVENYSAFISAAEAISFVKTQLEDFNKQLELLISDIWLHGVYRVRSTDCRRKEAEPSIMANHSTILDLLEIPHVYVMATMTRHLICKLLSISLQNCTLSFQSFRH
ncbi:conserved oligomeric Golgi complex subunit 8-like [Carex rostrata]